MTKATIAIQNLKSQTILHKQINRIVIVKINQNQIMPI